MPKKKKPHWPIWVTIALVICCIAVVLIDWERYPRAGEMEKYLVAQHSDVKSVEVTKVVEHAEGYEEARVYHLKYTYKDGREEENVFTLKAKDRKPVYPWHFYYRDRM